MRHICVDQCSGIERDKNSKNASYYRPVPKMPQLPGEAETLVSHLSSLSVRRRGRFPCGLNFSIQVLRLGTKTYNNGQCSDCT